MKFSAVLLSTFAAVAVAQTAKDSSWTPEQAACVKAANGDNPKIAECLGAAAPSEEMVNDTTKCAMACVQGDGSPKQTEAYAACQQDCITKKFFVSTLGSDGTNTPATKVASGASSASTAVEAEASKVSSKVSKVTSTASDGAVETTTSTPSATEEDAATETKDGSAESSAAAEDAATGLQAAGALTGFVALFAALFAL
jgi:hypothetical protein